jgi:putative SOS response-associated peptidase YedK
MCYSVSKSTQTKELLVAYRASIDEYMLMTEPSFVLKGFDHPLMDALILEEGQRKITSFNWGLIPSWAKTEQDAAEIKTKTINAMSETAYEKPSFRSAMASRRCIIPVNGFFEWRHKEKKTFPYYIQGTADTLLNLAGIYETWTNKETGEQFKTFSILTTSANKMMELIHNVKKRMPVIISDNDIDIYLDPSTPKDQVEKMMKPCAEEVLKAHTISRLITSRTADPNTPDLLVPYNYQELAETPTLF